MVTNPAETVAIPDRGADVEAEVLVALFTLSRIPAVKAGISYFTRNL